MGCSCFRDRTVIANRHGPLLREKKQFARVYMDSSEFLGKLWDDYVTGPETAGEHMSPKIFSALVQDLVDYLVALLQHQGAASLTYKDSEERGELDRVISHWRGAPVRQIAEAFFAALVTRYSRKNDGKLGRELFTTLPIVTLLEGIRWGKVVSVLWKPEQVKISRHNTLFNSVFIAVPVPAPKTPSPISPTSVAAPGSTRAAASGAAASADPSSVDVEMKTHGHDRNDSQLSAESRELKSRKSATM